MWGAAGGGGCHMLRVTCHWRQQPQPQTLPLLNSQLSTVGWLRVGWLQKPENNWKHAHKNIIETEKKKLSLQANISNPPFNQRFPLPPWVGIWRWHRHTDIQTLWLYNWIGQRADSVKMTYIKLFEYICEYYFKRIFIFIFMVQRVMITIHIPICRICT